MASLKTNVLLNYVNTFTSIVFPVITFPYATRVIQVEGIGLTNFYGSLVNYITLFSGVGIQMYAAKEVAKYRDNPALRNQCTVEIALLGFAFCALGYIAVGVLGAFVPSIHAHLDMFLVLSLSVFFTAIGVDWFYRAIEDFTFITIRALVFRSISAVALFIFVRSPRDLLAYCFVIVSVAVGNNFINFIHLRKYIDWRTIPWRRLRVWHHLPQTLKIFIPNLVTNMYGYLNIAMLGFMQSAAIVGLYSAGSKLVLIALTVINSLSIVLLPRSSNLIAAGRLDEFRRISIKGVRLVLILALPGLALMSIIARPLMILFCGAAFADAWVVVALTAPLLVIVGLSNIFGIQMLYAQGKERIVIGSMLAGLAINFGLNLWLIPTWHYTGAALAMITGELVVLLVQLSAGRRYIPFGWRDLVLAKPVAGALLLALVAWGVNLLKLTAWQTVISATLLGLVAYTLVLALLHDSLFYEILGYATSLVRRRKVG